MKGPLSAREMTRTDAAWENILAAWRTRNCSVPSLGKETQVLLNLGTLQFSNRFLTYDKIYGHYFGLKMVWNVMQFCSNLTEENIALFTEIK